jgi:hypothetical protein
MYYQDATGPLTMVGNTIQQNGARGVWYRNTTAPASDVQYIGNTVSDNGNEGIVSSRARYVDNTFTGNNYPLGAAGYLGYIYTDNTGVDGNTFSGNTNNAISLRDAIGDTLQHAFPQGLTSKTYVVRASLGDYSSSALVIEPGVIMKFTGSGRISRSKRFDAIGTETMPIVWTSWRDASYGGKTNAAADTLGPQAGNWQYVRLIGNQGAHDSRIEHVIAQYGAYPLYITNVPLVHPMRNLTMRQNGNWGLYFEGSTATLDSITADTSKIGIGAYNNSTISVSNSTFRGNTSYGIYADNGTEYSQVTNSVFAGNQRGIWISLANAPQVFQNNVFQGNTDYGVVALGEHATIDTLLIIDGNTFSNNGIGLRSSRAYIVDNTFLQNTYPLAVTGQLSLAGTGNENGNVYAGNSFQDNQHDVIRLIGNMKGVLGGSVPDSLPANVYAMFATWSVASGTELQIRKGTTIKASGGPNVNVNGTLHVTGTNADRVIITSWRDDTYGGDSNRDSSASTPGIGDMGYVRLLNTSSGTIHAVSSLNMRYSWYGLSVENISQLTVDSSLFANNSYGFYRSGTGTTRFTNSEFRDNTYGMFNQAGGLLSVSGSNFSGNTTYAFRQSHNSTADADSNYWGAPTGPLVTNGPDLNPGGTGDKIDVSSGTVMYRPFFTGRSGVLAGDVSENGEITAYDASLTLQHVVGSITLSGLQQSAADVTQDGSVSALDASFILRYVVGYISGFRTLTAPQGKGTVVPSYQVRTSSIEDGEMEMIIAVSGDDIFATEMDVSFPREHWEWVSAARTDLSDQFLFAHASNEGVTKVAMAGAVAPTEAGDWLVIRLRPLTDQADAADIRVSRFQFQSHDDNLVRYSD